MRLSPRSASVSRHQRRDVQFHTAAAVWAQECATWEAGTHPDLVREPALKVQYPYYWQWAGPPPEAPYSRPRDGAACHIHETVRMGHGGRVVLRMRIRPLRRTAQR